VLNTEAGDQHYAISEVIPLIRQQVLNVCMQTLIQRRSQMLLRISIILTLVLALPGTACVPAEKPVQGNKTVKVYNTKTKETKSMEKVIKSDEEWRKILSDDQFRIARKAGTERAFTGEYWDTHDKGTYVCRSCGIDLFSSDTKFNSGTGWPSFYAPVSANNVELVSDGSLGAERTEVTCARCSAHLGHVFDDGPKLTGKRYCMNSASLKLNK